MLCRRFRYRLAWGRLSSAGGVALLCFVLTACAAACGAPAGSLVGGPSYPPPAGALTVSFIDVGQGDSILVQGGGENHLIDAGKPEEGPNVVDFLRSRGVKKLDGLISTSGDSDHSGGLADVLDAFPVEHIYVSGYPKATLTYTNFLRTAREEVRSEGATFQKVSAGMQMDWSGVEADVLNPPPTSEPSLSSNDSSVGLLLTSGTARVLLAGDAEKNAEEYMAGGPDTGPVTIMKVDHHGSNTSTTPLFLSRFRPTIAVIQCGAGNPYGHPRPEVLDRLQRAGVKVFRNDLDGDVVATIRKDEVEVAVTDP